MRAKTPQVSAGSAASVADGGSRREILWWAIVFGLLTILVRIPFAFRYDIYFQSSVAPCFLMAKRMLSGEFSIYLWGTDYCGIGPVDFVTAGLFALFGPSIPLACFASLLFWGCGVGLLVAYVGCFWDKRAAVGVGIALTVGVPFFLLYSTQP